jgi:hypothetical protein
MASAFWHAADFAFRRRAGAELRGPIEMLVLLLTGRTMTALPHLSGRACRQSSSQDCACRLTKADHPASTTIHEGR